MMTNAVIDPDADLISQVASKFGKRALCIFAHPDDLEFTCGGTVAKLCAEGWDVHIVVTTSGNKGTKDPTVTSQQLAGEREEEARRAAAIFGAREPVFFGFPDGGIVNDDELRALVTRQVRPHRPAAMLLTGAGTPDYHVDIRRHLRTKIRAALAHTSQMHGRTERDMRAMYEERARQAEAAGEPGPRFKESFARIIFRR